MSAQAAKRPWVQLPAVLLAQGPTAGLPMTPQQRPPPARPALTASGQGQISFSKLLLKTPGDGNLLQRCGLLLRKGFHAV